MSKKRKKGRHKVCRRVDKDGKFSSHGKHRKCFYVRHKKKRSRR